ncbi:uncharacterized protein LOC126745612 [Anthonomus grandis grandis]|uniref:uncharacterized protein LOC126745612 n=1 Tax=Anthonomus grandis grandis TaxID=2921223 RepID=UPI00216659F4|nr:uncharacterized protein LOC126745612 [Anthonomus grandis grandis]
MAAKIDEILLIELVRKHECLYNMNSKHYRDQNMIGEAWEEIAQEINIAADALKTAWNKLRNCFFNAQKRRKTKSGQASTKLAKWKFEKEMEFLLPYLETRQRQTNLIEEVQELNDEDDEEVVHETTESQDEQELSVNNSTLSRNSDDFW